MAAPDSTPAHAHPLKVVDLYKAVIGPMAQAHYLKAFARQESASGFRLGWHWPAFWSALNWMLYRRMASWGVRYLLLALAWAALWGLLGWQWMGAVDATQPVWWTLAGGYWLSLSVVSALTAHGLYYRHCMALIQRVLLDGCDRETAHERLSAQAPSRGRAVAWAMAYGAVALLSLGAWLFRPEAVLTPALAPQSATPSLAEPVLERASPPTAAVGVPPTEAAVLPSPLPGPGDRPLLSEAWWSSQVTGLAPQPPRAETMEAPLPDTPDAASSRLPAANPPEPGPANGAGQRGGHDNGLVLQVGIFADPANVGQLLRRLRAEGLVVYAEPVDTGPKAGLTRVRVGPFGTPAEAEAVARKLRGLGLPAVPVKP